MHQGILNIVKSQSGHAEKPFEQIMLPAKGFSAWPLLFTLNSQKNSSNHSVHFGFFSMTTLSFDKFFDLQSFLMMVVLLLFLYENKYFMHDSY